MKLSLLKHYFDGNFFMNQVIVAAFRHQQEWTLGDLVHLVALVATHLDAPKMDRGTQDQVVNWVRSGMALLEKRGDEHYLRPGKTHQGQDIRELGDIPPAVLESIAPCSEKVNQMREYLANLGGSQ